MKHFIITIDKFGYADASNGNRQVDPAVKMYVGIPLVINTNNGIKTGTSNGTLCRSISIKLKKMNS